MAKDGGKRPSKPSKEDLFFAQKKDWSRTKDRILSAYLVPYLQKVKLRGAPIVLIDAYAGAGKFVADGSPGSPLQITQIAEKIVPGRYTAIFGNKRLRSHQKLTTLLGPLIERGVVQTRFQEADALLMELGASLGRATLFLYLDPTGLPPSFSRLKPFLERAASTEILLNLFPSAIARHASMGRVTRQIEALHHRLTEVMGNEYWRGVFERDDIGQDEKVERVMGDYVLRLRQYLPFSGACPIRQREGSAVKYHMTFFSRHPDAPILYNDTMRKAYREGLYRAMTKGTLLEGADELVDNSPREVEALKDLVLDVLHADGRKSRLRLWRMIVNRHFMEYGEPNYKQAVRLLCEEHRIDFVDVKGTGRLNDDAILFLMPPSKAAAA